MTVVTMADERAEACGRCTMTSVVDLREGPDGESRDPFAGNRIEIADSKLRKVSGHVVFLGRLKRRIDEIATSITYGR